MNFLYIYILLSALSILQSKWDKINQDTKFVLVVLSASNKYLTNFRLKTAIKLINRCNYTGIVYVCGKELGKNMKEYLGTNGIKNDMKIIDSSNTSEDATLLKQALQVETQNIVLVTSISHQRRAFNSFKKVFNNTAILSHPAWNELFSPYSPLLPTGWIAALLNTIKNLKYNQI